MLDADAKIEVIATGSEWCEDAGASTRDLCLTRIPICSVSNRPTSFSFSGYSIQAPPASARLLLLNSCETAEDKSLSAVV